MAENKTQPTAVSVDDFIAAIDNPIRRADAMLLRELMERVTGEPATMWGPTIVGFGRYYYRYASGRQGDMCRIGFAPRGAKLVLYVGGFSGYDDLLERLGKHKRATACLYLTRLADVHMAVLDEIVRRSFEAAGDSDETPAC